MTDKHTGMSDERPAEEPTDKTAELADRTAAEPADEAVVKPADKLAGNAPGATDPQGQTPGNEGSGSASTRRGPRVRVLIAAAVAAIALAALGIWWYVNIQMPRVEAARVFEAAADGLEQRNTELDEAISNLQDLMRSDESPLDSTTLDEASAAIGAAQAAKQDAPEMPAGTDDIRAAAEDIDGMGDYSAELEALRVAQANLRQSIDQLKQVTDPSEQFVLERLSGLPNITGAEAVTEQNDPNGNLHKDGGYTAAIYFSSDLVDSSQLYAQPGYTGIPAVGTDAGGCVEVYATAEDAEERNDYLASFDGTILNAGSHAVVGTCVIRTSYLLTASEQDAIEKSIIDSLTRLA